MMIVVQNIYPIGLSSLRSSPSFISFSISSQFARSFAPSACFDHNSNCNCNFNCNCFCICSIISPMWDRSHIHTYIHCCAFDQKSDQKSRIIFILFIFTILFIHFWLVCLEFCCIYCSISSITVLLTNWSIYMYSVSRIAHKFTETSFEYSQ